MIVIACNSGKYFVCMGLVSFLGVVRSYGIALLVLFTHADAQDVIDTGSQTTSTLGISTKGAFYIF